MSAGRGPQELGAEQRLQLLIDAVTEYAIYMLDAEGRVTTWNSGARRIKGYSAAEVIGQHFSIFFTPEDRKNAVPHTMLVETARLGRFAGEGWRVRKGGGRFWASVVLEVVRDDSGRLLGFAKVTRDNTLRRAAEQALLESERRFRLLTQAVVDYAICMLDPNGVVVHWNAGAERVTGYTADEIVGQHFSRFHPREERAAGTPNQALQTAAREGHCEIEGWRIRKDGGRFWASVAIDPIYEDGALVGFAEITRDTSERRAALDALRDSERQFRLLVDGVIDYAIFLIDPRGIVISWNAGAARIKGYTGDEIIGQHFSRFYTEADRAAGFPTHALNTARAEGRFESEGWRVRKDGTLFWANAVLDAIRDESGTLIGFAKVTRDMTERRAAALKLQKAQEQLAHSQRMEALGQLTGGVAHDFNNLLAVVAGHNRMVKRLLSDHPSGTRITEAIAAAVERGAALTRQLLSFSRQQRLRVEAVNLPALVAHLHEMLSSAVSSGITLVMDVPDKLWRIRTDPHELELALLNLVVNARDAMPKGGSITVTAENVELAEGQVADVSAGQFVAIHVRDVGEGIPPDILSRIFEPFFTTKEAERGTGLGLAQVYGFARQSGGGVAVGSTLGQGTDMTMYLPRATDEVQSAAAEAADALQVPENARVLLVEDNPAVAEVSADMVTELGYEIETVGNAAAALARLESGGPEIHLVLSDVVMAGELDGLGLARLLRQKRPDLPVLLASGYAKVFEGLQGEFPMLRKPYDIADLGRAISVLLRHAHQPAGGGNLVNLRSVRRARQSDDPPH